MFYAELNQSLCSHVFPAALSLLQQPCHASELLRPTLSVLMSCIAGNGRLWPLTSRGAVLHIHVHIVETLFQASVIN